MSTIRYRLSMGHIIHELTYNPSESRGIEVKSYRHRWKQVLPSGGSSTTGSAALGGSALNEQSHIPTPSLSRSPNIQGVGGGMYNRARGESVSSNSGICSPPREGSSVKANKTSDPIKNQKTKYSYSYAVWDPATRCVRSNVQTFTGPQNFNWNYLDNLICGEFEGGFLSNLQYRRLGACLGDFVFLICLYLIYC